MRMHIGKARDSDVMNKRSPVQHLNHSRIRFLGLHTHFRAREAGLGSVPAERLKPRRRLASIPALHHSLTDGPPSPTVSPTE